MSSPPGAVRRVAVASVLALLALAASSGFEGSAGATTYPPLSEPGRAFLSNLSAPSIAPGGSTSVAFQISDPENFSLDGATLTLAVYAFDGYPGGTGGTLSVANAPLLSNGSASGGVVNVSLGTVAPGESRRGSVSLTSSPDTPAGTFAIRTALSFHAAAQPYRLASRGWFSASVWQAATDGPNGSGTVNLTVLNVSGILAETAVLVRPSYWPVVLGVLLAVGLGLVGVGAWVYFRRGASSSSGAG